MTARHRSADRVSTPNSQSPTSKQFGSCGVGSWELRVGGRRLVFALFALTCPLMLGGCARGCTSSSPPIHLNPSMDDQPKVLPQTASTFFYNGSAMREPVPGTIPVGGLKEDTGGRRAIRPDRSRAGGRGACRAWPPALFDLLPAVPRCSGRWQGDPVSASQRSDRFLPPGKDPEVYGRSDLRRDHKRRRADVRVPVADSSRRQVGDRRIRAGARTQAAGQRGHARCH